jgi:hypothetical protein
VKSVWRRDGSSGGSAQRWGRSKQRVLDRTKHSNRGSTLGRKYSRHRQARLRVYLSSSPSSRSGASSRSGQYAPQGGTSGSMTSDSDDRDTGSRSSNDALNQSQNIHLGLMTLNDDTWIDDLILEASTTMWQFNSPLLKSSDDDWSEVDTKAVYQITPTILYRGQLSLYSRWLDLSVSYETKTGVKFLGEKGSLLNLAFALPDLIPTLAPLSLSYQRVRFAEGVVSLKDSGFGTIERQGFEMDIDRYEGRWLLNHGASQGLSTMSIFMGYDRRGVPRHVFLKENISLGEGESYDIYTDISDQLLWTVSKIWDVGLALHIQASDSISLLTDVSVGFGSYQMFTPLEGISLDRGDLIGLGFKVGVEYAVPITPWFTLKASYMVKGRGLVPVGLPNRLTEELIREEVDIDDLSLSFGTIDLLQRAWVSLVFNLASRPVSL